MASSVRWESPRLVLFILYSLCFCYGQEYRFDVSLSGATVLTISQTSAPATSETTSLSTMISPLATTTTFTYNNTLLNYTNPVYNSTSWTLSSLPPALQSNLSSLTVLENIIGAANWTFLSTDKLYQITPTLFLVRHADVPYVSYLGFERATSIVYQCPRVLEYQRTYFACKSLTSTPSLFNISFTMTSDQSIHVDFSIFPLLPPPPPSSQGPPPSSVVVGDMLSIAVSRLQVYQKVVNDIDWIRQHNDDRTSSSRKVLGVLFFFVAVAMFALLLCLAVWLSFVCPITLLKQPHWSTITYLLVVFFIAALVTGLTGIGGMIVMAILYGVVALILVLGFVAFRTYRHGCKQGFCSCGILCCKQPEQADVSRSVNNSPVEPIVMDPFNSPSWRRSPNAMGTRQGWVLFGVSVTFILACIISGSIFAGWKVADYYVWARDGSLTNPQLEFIPPTVAKGLQASYAFPKLATEFKLNNIFFGLSAEWCGPTYSKELTTDQQKYDKIYVPFIQLYNIDMSEFDRSSYTQYKSVNDWFTRGLANGTRVISEQLNAGSFVSPADARVMAFRVVPADSDIWIKGESFNMGTLTGQPYFDGGSLIMVRLAPQDYHRFHMPFDGTIVSVVSIAGPLYSVSADGITSDNGAIYNQRKVILFNTQAFGRVSYIAIGATCVGSIKFETPEENLVGMNFTKGQLLGHFEFGGSTVALAFEANRIMLNDDVVIHTSRRVETLLRMGQRIGTSVNLTSYPQPFL